MKKLFLIFLFFFASSVFLFFSCRNDAGGEGVDFDETLYYTKSEVDSLITSLQVMLPAVTEGAQELQDAKRSFTAAGYGNRVTWVNPNAASVVLFMVYVYATNDNEQVIIDVGVAEGNSYPFYFQTQAGENNYLFYIPLGNTTDDIHAWINSTYPFPTVTTFDIYPIVWFPQS
jgi:hypothetical protein